ncbi:hypothetical protein [Nocardioides sp. AX2bis]|uniref:hypothetical protein n=1 Tax=Nocardioides sp. AX2bis TaxID=2653157 RepID=UPI0012F2CCD6|nr:hypothetical protein [Nocardioides sp. AX2bis]VXB42898.1 exported hypothetical protein [Nocardioides sp. AX2bis]
MRRPAAVLLSSTTCVLVLGLAVPLAGAAGAAGATGAAAGRQDCVTRAEFRAVEQGTTKRAVHATFGTAGVFGDGGAGGFSRLYDQCRASTPGGEQCDVVVEYAAGPEQRPRVGAKRFDGVCG